MRSLLFVPGNSAKMMAKAAASGADVLIFDLEDAVHPDAKPAARQLVAEALASSVGGGPARYVRVNALDSTWCMGDLEAVLPAGPDGIMLPKLMGPEDLHVLGGLIGRWELPARRDLTHELAEIRRAVEEMDESADKISETPLVGHELFKIGTLTDKVPQFHLLAAGNPKPETFRISPLYQITIDGRLKREPAGA